MVNQLPYDKWTKRELLQCLNWAKKLFRLMDWDIKLRTNVKISKDDQGEVNVSISKYKATVSINNKRCELDDISPAQVLIHEMIHVATLGKTSMAGIGSEYVSRLFEYPLTCLYLGIEL